MQNILHLYTYVHLSPEEQSIYSMTAQQKGKYSIMVNSRHMAMRFIDP